MGSLGSPGTLSSDLRAAQTALSDAAETRRLHNVPRGFRATSYSFKTAQYGSTFAPRRARKNH
eukprot:7788843-Pyramimonas_sp.AAC.1